MSDCKIGMPVSCIPKKIRTKRPTKYAPVIEAVHKAGGEWLPITFPDRRTFIAFRSAFSLAETQKRFQVELVIRVETAYLRSTAAETRGGKK